VAPTPCPTKPVSLFFIGGGDGFFVGLPVFTLVLGELFSAHPAFMLRQLRRSA
jgi:hypothetical protein